MADTKVTALTAATPLGTDVLYLVDDPGGIPSSKKATVSSVVALAPVTSVAGETGVIAAVDLRTALNVEDGADVTDTANVTAAGALMDSEVTNLAAVKAFDPADYATAAQGSLAATATQPADIANMVESDPSGVTGADAITNMMSLTQAEYNAIGAPDASTFYLITDAT